MSASNGSSGKVLLDIRHGGHVVADPSPSAERAISVQEGLTALRDAVPADVAQAVEAAPVDTTTPFGYLAGGLAQSYPASHLPDDDPAAVVAALGALGAAMVEDPPSSADTFQSQGNSTIPPVYTYWGQFVDHDLTANTDRDSAVSDITRPDLVPLEPDFVVDNLRNLRQPELNLDSVYGDGPTLGGGPATEAAGFYDGIRLKVGTVAIAANDPSTTIGGDRIPPDDDLARDLPRDNLKAMIGDGRNDENLIIAQLHTAFLRFHNAAVDWVKANEAGQYTSDAQVFARARRLTRWHYQWLTVHDYLATVTLPGVADKVLLGGNKHFTPPSGQVFMPLEFSVAGFRFGHTMVRAVYDYNRNFGRPGKVLPSAPFGLLFTFTGNGFPQPFIGQTDVLPFNWIIEWDRMTQKGAHFPDRFARRIDTRLAPPLRDLSKEGNAAGLAPPIKELLKRLATRNLVRGYLLAIPTGQALAGVFGVPVLTEAELKQENNPIVNDALVKGGFLAKTPLWYYVLKEAEVRANGNSLGELGSRIVCETIIGQVRNDPDSYLQDDWTPAEGVTLPNGDPVVTIGDFLRFAGVMP